MAIISPCIFVLLTSIYKKHQFIRISLKNQNSVLNNNKSINNIRNRLQLLDYKIRLMRNKLQRVTHNFLILKKVRKF